MAKVKYNVSGVDSSDFTPVKPGMYRAKIEEINDWSGQYGAGMEVVLTVVSDSQGKKKDVEGIGSKLWTYIYLDHEPSAFRLAEFIRAIALKDSGTLDTEKQVGKEVQVRVKSDRNEDGEYRPRVGKLLPLADEAGAEEEPEEPEEGEPEDEGDGEDVDLDDLDRAALKKLIKDQELDITVKKAWTDDQLRAEIATALGAEDEEDGEEEEGDEEEGDEDDAVDLDKLDRAGLKAFIKENELAVKVMKSDSDDDIRAKIAAAAEADSDDGEEEEGEEGDETPDYKKWSAEQLKAEIKERGLKLTGGFTKPKAVKLLEKDDKSDDEPF